MMNADISFKIMAAKDLDGVLAIEKEAFPTPWPRNLFQREVELSFSRHFVLTIPDSGGQKEIIGYIVFWLIHDEFQLQRIAVKKAFQGQGIGSLLLEEMIRICKLEEVISGTLEVRSGNIAAQALYRKFGFNVLGLRKGYYSDTREDAMVLGIEIKVS